MKVRTMGEFFGDGYASVVLFNTVNSDWGLWKEPVLTFGEPWSNQYVPITIVGSGAKLQVDGVLAGVGDFNGDGKSDILWYHQQSGKLAMWFMNGLSYSSAVNLPEIVDPSFWQMVRAGDFDGDGKAGIFWRNKFNGNNAIWLMNGATIVNAQPITPVSDLTRQAH